MLEAALRAVVENPDSLAPRLEYARLVRATDPARAECIDRETDPDWHMLLVQNGERWVREALGPLADEVTRMAWAYGFIEEIDADASVFIRHAAELVRRAPVRCLVLTDIRPGELAEVLARPEVAQLRALQITSFYEGIGDDEATMIASCPRLSGLRWLDLAFNDIGPSGADAILRSRHLGGVRWLGFDGNRGRAAPRIGGIDHGQVMDMDWPAHVLARANEADAPAWLRWRYDLKERPDWYEVVGPVT